jgi:hypothetical protein
VGWQGSSIPLSLQMTVNKRERKKSKCAQRACSDDGMVAAVGNQT